MTAAKKPEKGPYPNGRAGAQSQGWAAPQGRVAICHSPLEKTKTIDAILWHIESAQ